MQFEFQLVLRLSRPRRLGLCGDGYVVYGGAPYPWIKEKDVLLVIMASGIARGCIP